MKRLISLIISLIIVAFIWWKVDVHAIAEAARQADALWLTMGILTVIPLTLATAWRFHMLSRTDIGLGVASRLILSASTLNLVLPSKMGDLAKAWVLDRRYGYDPKLAFALVVFEKMLDMASLLFWGVFALIWMRPDDPVFLVGALATAGLLVLLMLLLSPWAGGRGLTMLGRYLPKKLAAMADQWHDFTRWFWSHKVRAINTISLSLAIWAGHLFQFWLYAKALGQVPLIGNMAAATLSILAGLMPLTMAGVGTRDAAIVYFYHDWLTPAQCAMLGLLATLRYVLPAIAGLPFMGDYLHRREASGAA